MSFRGNEEKEACAAKTRAKEDAERKSVFTCALFFTMRLIIKNKIKLSYALENLILFSPVVKD